jgi:alkylation response protein AidB-like acyl-CoA dehydrogenase
MTVELLRADEPDGDRDAGRGGAGADYVARARRLLPLMAEAAAGVEADRRLDERVVTALHEAGLFRMMMPRWLGGGEAPPSQFVQVIETIARADASTAWCLSQMTVCSLSSVYLERDAAREVFGGPRAALAWGSTPDARAVRVPGGYRVTGTWEFGSGCHHATWLGGHIAVVEPDGAPVLGEDGEPLERTMLFPKAAACIEDVWHVIGLRGTGSDLYRLEDYFIPEKHTLTSLFRWPDPPRLKLAVPYRFGGSSLYASGFACVALGNARGMLDEFIDLSQRKVPRWGKNPLADNMIVQVAVAECDTQLASALVYLVQNLRDIEAAAARRQPGPAGGPTMDERMKIRAAGTYALRLATGVVNRLYEMAGTTAIFDGNPFDRRFRDAHTISQHAQGRISHMETVGKHLLGIEQVPRFV